MGLREQCKFQQVIPVFPNCRGFLKRRWWLIVIVRGLTLPVSPSWQEAISGLDLPLVIVLDWNSEVVRLESFVSPKSLA